MDNKNLIPIMSVVYDEQTREYAFAVPQFDRSIEHYKRQYGAVGQRIAEIGTLIQRKEYPHFMREAPWIHVVPENDIIPHNHGPHIFECSCGPTVDCKHGVVVHSALDGRKYVRPKQEGWAELYADR